MSTVGPINDPVKWVKNPWRFFLLMKINLRWSDKVASTVDFIGLREKYFPDIDNMSDEEIKDELATVSNLQNIILPISFCKRRLIVHVCFSS